MNAENNDSQKHCKSDAATDKASPDSNFVTDDHRMSSPPEWEKLSPHQFQELQEYISYGTIPFKEFAAQRHLDNEGSMDFGQFQSLMKDYLGANVPEKLLKSVFKSLLKRRPTIFSIPPANSTESRESYDSADSFAGKRYPQVSSGSQSLAVRHPVERKLSTSNNISIERVQSLGQLVSGPSEATDRSQTPPKVQLLSPPQRPLTHLQVHQTLSQSTGDLVEEDDSDSELETAYKDRLSRSGSNPAPECRLSREESEALELNDGSSSRITTRDLSCYLSLLEAGQPEDKLEFLFRLYDSDGNGTLDSNEMEAIVNQMMNVAGYLGWECSELRPILEDMMREIDRDNDGIVTLDEWKCGGMTTIPLLVLLGLDTNVRDDGSHVWRLKHFRNASYCYLCDTLLLGLGKKGLICVFCHYTAHEKCVQLVPRSCIATYSPILADTTSTRLQGRSTTMCHVWIQGNVSGKCERCNRNVKLNTTCWRCRWCQAIAHNKCVKALPAECNLGPLREHILPPACIRPVILDARPRRPSAVSPPTSHHNLAESSKATTDRASPVGEQTHSVFSAANSVDSNGHLGNPSVQDTSHTQSQVTMPNSSSSFNTSLSHPRPASFQIKPLPGTRPLLVFVNPKSGGHQGMKILAKFQYVLNPRQVYNLTADRGPYTGLKFFRDVRDFRILCCGGDGTIGWLMDAIDKANLEAPPPIAMLPLGTGNDLARCLRWGGGYEDGDALVPLLERISKSTQVMLDRWRIEVELPNELPEAETEADGDPVPFNIMNNYFSLGVDAQIAHRFHVMREKHPEKFNSRIRNKLWYLELGASESVSTTCKNLQEQISIWCDGELLDLTRGPNLEAIAVLNIPSIYGGSNLWGDKQLGKQKNKQNSIDRDPDSTYSLSSECADFVIQDIGDRLFEVVGLQSTLHAAKVWSGLMSSAIRLRQCSSCVIRTQRRLPMQIDGEPWLQPPCTIRINHRNQVPMLMAPKKKASKWWLGLLPSFK